MAHSLTQLKQLTDQQLDELYDETAKRTSVGLQFYRDEIAHRENERQTQAMLEMTEKMLTISERMDTMTSQMVTMTRVVVLLTVISVVAAVVAAIAA